MKWFCLTAFMCFGVIQSRYPPVTYQITRRMKDEPIDPIISQSLSNMKNNISSTKYPSENSRNKSQNTDNAVNTQSQKKGITKSQEDMLYQTKITPKNGEIKQQSNHITKRQDVYDFLTPDFLTEMRVGGNYNEMQKKFVQFYSQNPNKKGRTRYTGETFLKEKIFFLDDQGNVQKQPIQEDDPPQQENQIGSETTTKVGSWTLIGPFYAPIGSVDNGGYITMAVIDPNNKENILVGYQMGGLWLTRDRGKVWTLTDSTYPDSNYKDIDFCYNNSNIVYALSNQQLLKSLDGGLNWKGTKFNRQKYPEGGFLDIAASKFDEDIVLITAKDKVYRSEDGGQTWEIVLSNLKQYQNFSGGCGVFSEMTEWSNNQNDVYLVELATSTSHKIWKSSDKGKSFKQFLTIPLKTKDEVVSYGKILFTRTNKNEFFLAVGSGKNQYSHMSVHFYKIDQRSGKIKQQKINMGGLKLHHGDIAIDIDNQNNIVVGTYGQTFIHYSTDGGNTFQTSSQTHYDIRRLAYSQGLLFVGTDGQGAISTDFGKTLKTATRSISNHELWGFGSAFKSNMVATGNNHGPLMIKQEHNGSQWINVAGADQGNTDVNPLDNNYVYSQGYANYRFGRRGPHKWTNENNMLDLGGIYSYFNSMEFNPNHYYSMITHHAGKWKNSLIRSDDNGDSVQVVKTFDNQVFRQKISTRNPQNMIVLVGKSKNQLWLSKDGYKTWTNITPSKQASSNQLNISDIAIGDDNPNQIWVTYSQVQKKCKVLKSDDFGKTWKNLTTQNLTQFPITKIVFQRGSNGGVYIGSKAGIFYRNNQMSQWKILGRGLVRADIRFMFINYNEHKLKIGTSRGAFEHDLFEYSKPSAVISSNILKITCPQVQAVKFKDYSVIRNNRNASSSWSFPGGTPSQSNQENPTVSYQSAENGNYSVTLKIQDQFGQSQQTLENFISINNICGDRTPKQIVGNAIKLTGSNYLKLDDLDLQYKQFSFSCWIKPNGIQQDWSGIFMIQDGQAFGLNFKNSKNQLGYHPNYNWNSNLIIPANQWSHVAFVSNNRKLSIYLNGKQVSTTLSKATDNKQKFNSLVIGRYGKGYSDRVVKAEMDEVCIWSRALGGEQVRKYMKLFKKKSDPIFKGLEVYLQFNQKDYKEIILSQTPNKKYAKFIGGSQIVASSVSLEITKQQNIQQQKNDKENQNQQNQQNEQKEQIQEQGNEQAKQDQRNEQIQQNIQNQKEQKDEQNQQGQLKEQNEQNQQQEQNQNQQNKQQQEQREENDNGNDNDNENTDDIISNQQQNQQDAQDRQNASQYQQQQQTQQDLPQENPQQQQQQQQNQQDQSQQEQQEIDNEQDQSQ